MLVSLAFWRCVELQLRGRTGIALGFSRLSWGRDGSSDPLGLSLRRAAT